MKEYHRGPESRCAAPLACTRQALADNIDLSVSLMRGQASTSQRTFMAKSRSRASVHGATCSETGAPSDDFLPFKVKEA